MANKLTFSQSPYFDDFDAENDFYKILYRPGYAVQARELTQTQSILQKQISSFGDHVFTNGARVIPGAVSSDGKVHFVKLDTFYNSLSVDDYLNDFRNTIVTGLTSGVKMQVIDVSDCDCVTEKLDILTLYCKIIDTDATGSVKRFTKGETLVALKTDNTVAKNPDLTVDLAEDRYANIRSLADDGTAATANGYTNDEINDVMGYACQIDVKEGIYYIDGYFVRTPELHLYIGRFSNNPSARVGFKVSEAIVTPEEDSNLLDNATGSSNYAAPGAHRYKMTVSLTSKTIESAIGNADEDEDRFIELIRLEHGFVQQVVDKTSYSELEKTFARRTYDESGNYEVNKFRLSIKEHLNTGDNNGVYLADDTTNPGNNDQFVMIVDPGKAYVSGYEIENTQPKKITIDKARENTATGAGADHVIRADDKPFVMELGNYVIVNTTYNYPNIETFEKVYLLDEPKVTAGNGITAGDASIIGTARVRSWQLHSGDYNEPDPDDVEFKLGLFDISMATNKSFNADVKQIVSTAGTDAFLATIAPVYTNLIGSATATNGSTAVVGIGTAFVTEGVKAGDFIYIGGVYVGQAASVNNDYSITLKANFTGTTITSGERVQVGRAKLILPNNNSLLYPVGPAWIKTLRGWDGAAYTEKSTALSVRRVMTPSETPSGSSPNITAKFELTSLYESFPSINDLEGFTLMDTSTNTFIDIGTDQLAYGSGNNTRIVNISGLSSGSLKLIATVRQRDSDGAERTKTRTVQNDTITGEAKVTKNIVELSKADGYVLTSVMMSPGSYASYTASGAVDITNRYEFDDGQRPSYYTNAKLKLKPGYQPPRGAIKVTYEYFAHGSDGNYFSVDSYIDLDAEAMDLGKIPDYVTIDPATGRKRVVRLSSVLDFRPVLHSSVTSPKPELPAIGSNIEGSVAYYQGRIDKVTLDSLAFFTVHRGVPDANPKEPDDVNDQMTICTLEIPPFTADVNQIKIKQRENRRYTMKDIGRIEKRVKNLEYYVTLNLLEKDTADLQITDGTTGLDRFKNGFIVDSFTGHGIGDVRNEDYRIAVDPTRKQLRPMHFTTAVTITENIDSGSARTGAYKKTNDLITLPYTETTFISNPYATRSIDVNPYKVGAFKGEIELIPATDQWKDTDRRPDLLVYDDNNYDAIQYMADSLGVTGSFWNEWETYWTGTSQAVSQQNFNNGSFWGYNETITTTDTGYSERDGTEITLDSSVNSTDYGDRVVDLSYATTLRARPITFVATNLKPNSRFYSFFDDRDVGAYTAPANIFKLTNTGSYMTFDYNVLAENILQDDSRRSAKGELQPAFMGGDLLYNAAHNNTYIDSITYVETNTFDVEVASTDGILVGHHVVLHNLDNHAAYDPGLRDSPENTIPQSTGIASTADTAKNLNMKMYNVIDVDEANLTIRIKYINFFPDNPDFDITSIDGNGYSSAGYSDFNNVRGRVKRLQGSVVAVHGGIVDAFDGNDNILTQDVHCVNLKHGIAIGETLYGTTGFDYNGSTVYNQVTVDGIWDGDTRSFKTDEGDVPNWMSEFGGDPMRTDAAGTLVGVFNVPNTDTMYFNVGEKKFKLTDSESNSDDDYDSKGSATYFAFGMTLSKEKTIVNSRQAEFVEDRLYEKKSARRVSSSTRQVITGWAPPPGDGGGGDGHDPLAQTFTVNSTGGAFVTSVDLFFKETGTRPVIVELRSTGTNGVPSTKIIPFTQVVKQASELNTSDDGTVATTFNFKAPVFLQEGESYALVVKCDQPGMRAWISELGSDDIASTAAVSKTPLTGSLYLSQNSKEFEINPLLDLKFNLRKAKFDISDDVEVEFRANPPLRMKLPIDPFQITPGTNKIRVSAPNHGFEGGDKVRFMFKDVNMTYMASDTYYGTDDPTTGIPQSLLENAEHTVESNGIDQNSFIITLQTTGGAGNDNLLVGITDNNDFVRGDYGGSDVRMTRALQADQIYFKSNNLLFRDTTMQWYVDDNNGAWEPISENTNHEFEVRRKIDSYDNLATIVGTNVRTPSMTFKALITSGNENVSPVIDVQTLSAYATTNLINEPTFGNVTDNDIDLRMLLDTSTDVTNADITTNGTGSITTTVSSTTVTGASTRFEYELRAGDIIYQAGDTVGVHDPIGTVDSVTDDGELELVDAAASTLGGVGWFIIPGNVDMEFYNDGDYGVIKTRIDVADNLLGAARIGKHLYIDGVDADIDNDTVAGTWVIHRISTNDDADYYAGNTEEDNILLYVKHSSTGANFGSTITSTPVTKNMLTDNFTIQMYDRFVEDFAPVGTNNLANYVTRTLSLTEAANSLKILFDANIIQETKLKIYYRIWSGDTDLTRLPYVDTGYDSTLDPYDVDGVFLEREVDLTDLPPFTNVSIKMVMKSTNGIYVPKVKNLRMIAHS